MGNLLRIGLAQRFMFTQVYHIGRNLWCKMENRVVKNVCAPASVIDGKIYIVGGTPSNLLNCAKKNGKMIRICLFASICSI